MRRDFLTLKDIEDDELSHLLNEAIDIKLNHAKYENRLKNKTLLMIFAKPSLRTRLSFESGMHKLGGNAIFYELGDSVIGKKESVRDAAKAMSRYADIIMARLYAHEEIEELAKHSDVPVINGLTDFAHPCQVLGDLMTIKERFGKFQGLKLSYFGDANNNVTHSLMYGCDKAGINMTICCPKKAEFMPNPKVAAQTSAKIEFDPEKAIVGADIVYTDSWMSYHIPESEKAKRLIELENYRVTQAFFAKANPKAVFMHCLPAQRGLEVAEEVIDSTQSIIFDQAENRMWAQMALMIWLMIG